jgi:nucleoside-diphosphate-sugar epimerase
MNRVFVTGGCGFIGTSVLELLANKGIESISFDKRPATEAVPGVHYIEGNILDMALLTRSVKETNPDCVIHLAARCDLNGRSIEEYRDNTVGVQNVIDVVKGAGSRIRKILFTSSRYVHSNEVQPAHDDEYSPFTMYGISKVEGERLVRSSDLAVPWVLFRPTSIWGPRFGPPYFGFFRSVKKGLYVHPRGERILKSFGYVKNTAHQICELATSTSPEIAGRVFYGADYEAVEVRALATTIQREFSAPPVRDVPLSVLNGLARVGDFLQSVGVVNPPLTTFRLKNLRCPMVYDISLTQRFVGELPYSTLQGVQETVAWMQRR